MKIKKKCNRCGAIINIGDNEKDFCEIKNLGHIYANHDWEFLYLPNEETKNEV